MMKIQRHEQLEVYAMVGIDPAPMDSREPRGSVATTAGGIVACHEHGTGLIGLPRFGRVEIILDATSAKAYRR